MARGPIRIRTEVRAPIARCFDLSRDVDLHQQSMAFSKETAIEGVQSGLIGPGEFVRWEARHFGRRWRMTSRISEFDRPYRFVDESTEGPFSRFRHEHGFTECGPITVMADEVEFDLGFGVLGRLASVVVAAPYLRRLLRLRNLQLKQLAEAG